MKNPKEISCNNKSMKWDKARNEEENFGSKLWVELSRSSGNFFSRSKIMSSLKKSFIKKSRFARKLKIRRVMDKHTGQKITHPMLSKCKCLLCQLTRRELRTSKYTKNQRISSFAGKKTDNRTKHRDLLAKRVTGFRTTIGRRRYLKFKTRLSGNSRARLGSLG